MFYKNFKNTCHVPLNTYNLYIVENTDIFIAAE